ncbi:hypothetical protein [Rhodococcus sp. NPDC127528]|uniref:hypothetical protein n=1 Tax=unclassified Rhodococcus (in: high G+C Gram-positive bacteria) TaxID=192944 RepID=UPI00362870D8
MFAFLRRKTTSAVASPDGAHADLVERGLAQSNPVLVELVRDMLAAGTPIPDGVA